MYKAPGTAKANLLANYMAQSRALNHMHLDSRGCSSAFESVVSRFESDTLGTMIIFNTSRRGWLSLWASSITSTRHTRCSFRVSPRQEIIP